MEAICRIYIAEGEFQVFSGVVCCSFIAQCIPFLVFLSNQSDRQTIRLPLTCVNSSPGRVHSRRSSLHPRPHDSLFDHRCFYFIDDDDHDLSRCFPCFVHRFLLAFFVRCVVLYMQQVVPLPCSDQIRLLFPFLVHTCLAFPFIVSFRLWSFLRASNNATWTLSKLDIYPFTLRICSKYPQLTLILSHPPICLYHIHTPSSFIAVYLFVLRRIYSSSFPFHEAKAIALYIQFWEADV